jgi:hypothetical protein
MYGKNYTPGLAMKTLQYEVGREFGKGWATLLYTKIRDKLCGIKGCKCGYGK